MFATTVIFITKSMSLDLFFLRFPYSFFSMFSYTRATVWLNKNGCIEYGEEREREREREYDWYQNRKGLCKVDATLAWFSKTTLNLSSICYHVMKPSTWVYLHLLSLRKNFLKWHYGWISIWQRQNIVWFTLYAWLHIIHALH